MTEERLEGTARRTVGGAQEGLGRILGDRGMQLEGGLQKAKGVALDLFGRAVTGVESQIDRAPEGVRPYARKAVGFARERPGATLLGLAAVTFLLTRAGRRR